MRTYKHVDVKKLNLAVFYPENYEASKKKFPFIVIFHGGRDSAITVSEMVDFHKALKDAKNASNLYIGKEGKHDFCNGRNKSNRFFYWSLELIDPFLVNNHILKGSSEINIAEGVKTL
jgi:dienelactone hydrolase